MTPEEMRLMLKQMASCPHCSACQLLANAGLEMLALSIVAERAPKKAPLIPSKEEAVANAALTEANRLLIEAAPDLLEACITAQQDCGCELVSPCSECRILLRAIHKAEGISMGQDSKVARG
jgi:hypothetical protein